MINSKYPSFLMTNLRRIAFLFCCLGSTLNLSAQQSCYEQYLRENNIPLPADNVILHACYGAQVAEKVAEQNQGVNVSGATGRLDTSEYYDRNYKRKSKDVRNSTQRWLFGIIPFGRKNASWLTYRSETEGTSPIIIYEEKTAGHIVNMSPTPLQDF